MSTEKFHLRGISGIEIRYFECVNCGSLQTQEPIWLSQAYAHSNLSQADTGAAQRVLINHAFVLVAAKIFGLRTILDFGGGDGLLCRLLRDRGLDAHTVDDYATPTYAYQFRGSLERQYDLITAFEVFEHLPNPSDALANLFDTRPKFIIASTEIYSGQDANWWYLCPSQGQHVFFYSSRALRSLAQHHRYSYYDINGRHLFCKEPLTRVSCRQFFALRTGECSNCSEQLCHFRRHGPGLFGITRRQLGAICPGKLKCDLRMMSRVKRTVGFAFNLLGYEVVRKDPLRPSWHTVFLCEKFTAMMLWRSKNSIIQFVFPDLALAPVVRSY